MTRINQLPFEDDLQNNDQLLIFSTGNGTEKRTSVNNLVGFISSSLPPADDLTAISDSLGLVSSNLSDVSSNLSDVSSSLDTTNVAVSGVSNNLSSVSSALDNISAGGVVFTPLIIINQAAGSPAQSVVLTTFLGNNLSLTEGSISMFYEQIDITVSIYMPAEGNTVYYRYIAVIGMGVLRAEFNTYTNVSLDVGNHPTVYIGPTANFTSQGFIKIKLLDNTLISSGADFNFINNTLDGIVLQFSSDFDGTRDQIIYLQAFCKPKNASFIEMAS